MRHEGNNMLCPLTMPRACLFSSLLQTTKLDTCSAGALLYLYLCFHMCFRSSAGCRPHLIVSARLIPFRETMVTCIPRHILLLWKCMRKHRCFQLVNNEPHNTHYIRCLYFLFSELIKYIVGSFSYFPSVYQRMFYELCCGNIQSWALSANGFQPRWFYIFFPTHILYNGVSLFW